MNNRQFVALFAVVAASAVIVAACSKSTESSTSSSGSEAASAAPASTAEPAGSTMAAATTAPAGGSMAKGLPIPLAKLPNLPNFKPGDAKAGAKVFSANCESCHGAGGKNGTVGPTLAGQGLKAAQVAYMVRNPQAIDKDSAMPKLPVSDKDLADVAAYVESLK